MKENMKQFLRGEAGENAKTWQTDTSKTQRERKRERGTRFKKSNNWHKKKH